MALTADFMPSWCKTAPLRLRCISLRRANASVAVCRDGLGFYELFLLSEEICATPLPVVSVGLACQYQNRDADSARVHVALGDLQPYIDDALDLIEFANGGTDTPWG